MLTSLLLMGALSQLGEQLAHAVPADAPATVIVKGPGRLGNALAEQVEAELRRTGHRSGRTPEYVLEVSAVLADGKLGVSGELRNVGGAFWRRTLDVTAPAP